MAGGLTSLASLQDDMSSAYSEEIECGINNDSVYAEYNFTHRTPNDLPINSYRRQILSTLKVNHVLVLQGATGCGKTTQVPQFILDEAYAQRKPCNIVITQPRRIAAISNADRVARERNWPPKTVVGYQVGMDARSNQSIDTRILFCTTGVLLEKLIKIKSMAEYTHIILDEIHERSKDMDFLLIVIRKLLLAPCRPKVKIILMSATIDADQVFLHLVKHE